MYKPSYDRHPIGAMLPDMTREEKVSFLEDVRENGVREPGWLYEGLVLIGWHRYQAALKAGVEMLWRTYSGSDPVGFVLSSELRRRHLSPSQAARVELQLRDWRSPGRPKADESESPERPRSNAEMAAEAGVSERTMRRERRRIREERGEVSAPEPKLDPEPGLQIAHREPPVPVSEAHRLRIELDEVRSAYEFATANLTGERAEWARELGGLREEVSMLKARNAELQVLSTDQAIKLRDCRRALAALRRQMSATV